MNYKPYKHLPPFKGMVLQNFPFIEEDFDAITNYQLLCKVVEYLKNVINNEKIMEENVTNLYNSFTELKNYVDNYFANLDVQEEINNKLDDMVESGELQEIILNYINNKVEYIFPKFMPEAQSGDCEIIKYKDKNIMIDTYHQNQYTYIKDMLNDNEITHIDYLIITHYHVDHVGNFENLVNDGYIDENTIIYFPAEVTLFTDYASMPDYYKQYCIEHNLNYTVPNEFEYFNIDDLKITFYNCNAELLDRLYYTQASYKDYNNCSTVVLAEHNNIKVLYTGDILELAIERLYNSGLIKGQIDLYKVCHHGINVSTFKDFFELIKPKYAVQTTGIIDETINNFTIGMETSLIRELNCVIYPTSRQSDYIKFCSYNNNINCLVGKPYNFSHRRITETLYVNILASTNNIQNGTETYPFSEIGQAIGYISSHSTRDYIINCSDGNYYNVNTGSKKRLTSYIGEDIRITINGNSNDRTKVTINSCEIFNSYINFNNLTIYSNDRMGIDSYNSKIRLNNVLITSKDNNNTSYTGLLAREHSDIIVTGSSKIDKCSSAIDSNDSKIYLRSIVFGSNTREQIINNSNSIIYTNSINFDNNTDKLNFNDNNTIRKNSQLLFSGNEYTSVQLAKSSSNFDWIEIYYTSSDGNRNSTGRIYSPDGKKVVGICPQYNGTVVNNKQCKFEISGDTISITNHLNINITSDGTVTIDNTNNVIRILNVVGGFIDYINLN